MHESMKQELEYKLFDYVTSYRGWFRLDEAEAKSEHIGKNKTIKLHDIRVRNLEKKKLERVSLS